VGRRTVIKPALGAQIRTGKDGRNRIDERPWRLKELEAGDGSGPLQSVAEEVLPLNIERMSLCRPYGRALRLGHRKTGSETYREGANSQTNEGNAE